MNFYKIETMKKLIITALFTIAATSIVVAAPPQEGERCYANGESGRVHKFDYENNSSRTNNSRSDIGGGVGGGYESRRSSVSGNINASGYDSSSSTSKRGNESSGYQCITDKACYENFSTKKK